MKPPIVSCQVCRGTGHKALRGALLRTLTAIQRHPNSTVPQIRAALGEDTDNSTVNKRVERLVKVFKLVKSIKKGSMRHYSVRNGSDS